MEHLSITVMSTSTGVRISVSAPWPTILWQCHRGQFFSLSESVSSSVSEIIRTPTSHEYLIHRINVMIKCVNVWKTLSIIFETVSSL